jgi:predicted nucleic acid-binding protein
VLVVDASVVVEASLGIRRLADLGEDLVAPPLLWPEARSAIRQGHWRGVVTTEQAWAARQALVGAAVDVRDHPELGEESWRIADVLGWAKTYDAEYVALGSLLGCRVVTVDGRLRRGADRLGFVVGPLEL